MTIAAMCASFAMACGSPSNVSSTDAGPDAYCAQNLPDCPSDGGVVPSYASTIGPLIQDRCTSCHFPRSLVTRTDLTSYAQVYANRGSILSQVYSCAMPQSGPLQPDQRMALLTWLVCGAPNN